MIKSWVQVPAGEFSSPGSIFCADFCFSVQPPIPCVTAVACKRYQPFCQKCRWQVTAKYACTLCMWLCMKWHCKLVHLIIRKQAMGGYSHSFTIAHNKSLARRLESKRIDYKGDPKQELGLVSLQRFCSSPTLPCLCGISQTPWRLTKHIITMISLDETVGTFFT